MKPCYPLLLCGTFLFTACGKSTEPANTTATSVPVTTSQTTTTPTDHTASASAETQHMATSEMQPHDESKIVIPTNATVIDVSQFEGDISAFLNFLHVAQALKGPQFSTAPDDPNSEKEKEQYIMQHLSVEYVKAKRDPFEQGKIKTQQLPKLKDTLKAYEKDFILHIPFNFDTSTRFVHIIPLNSSPDYNATILIRPENEKLDQYDFENKSFSVTPPEMPFNQISVKLAVNPNTSLFRMGVMPIFQPQKLQMEDPNIAQKMHKKVGQRGFIEYYVKNTLLYPTQAKVEYFDPDTGETYAHASFANKYQ